jgi:hypothetical protein
VRGLGFFSPHPTILGRNFLTARTPPLPNLTPFLRVLLGPQSLSLTFAMPREPCAGKIMDICIQQDLSGALIIIPGNIGHLWALSSKPSSTSELRKLVPLTQAKYKESLFQQNYVWNLPFVWLIPYCGSPTVICPSCLNFQSRYREGVLYG